MPPIIGTIVRLVAIAGLVYLAMVGWLMFQLRTITDIDSYADIVETWDKEFVAHFPDPIAIDVEKARFSYFPGFLQGGAHIQLWLAPQPEQLIDVERKFSEQAILVTNTIEHSKNQNQSIDKEPAPLPPFHVAPDGDINEFPDNFTLYYLVARPGTTQGFLWNHGRTTGVAVSRKPPEIVYWAESW